MRSAISAINFFQPESPLRNAAGIFLLTTLFYFVGAELRLVEALSLLAAEWRDGRGICPLCLSESSALLCHVVCRHADVRRVHHQLGNSLSLVINLSNMVFIVTVALLVLRDKRRMEKPDP